MAKFTDDLKLAQAGNDEAWGRIITRLLNDPAIHAFAKRLLADNPKARQHGAVATDDIRQDVFMNPTLVDARNSEELLGRVRHRLEHVVIDSARKGGRTLTRVDVDGVPEVACHDDPADVLAQKEALRLALERLSRHKPNLYILFYARHVEGLTLEEVAAKTGVKFNTVRAGLVLANAFLKELLRD